MRARVAVVAFLGCVRVWRRSGGRLQFSVLTCVCIDSVIDSLSCFNFLILMKKYSYLRMQKRGLYYFFVFVVRESIFVISAAWEFPVG